MRSLAPRRSTDAWSSSSPWSCTSTTSGRHRRRTSSRPASRPGSGTRCATGWNSPASSSRSCTRRIAPRCGTRTCVPSATNSPFDHEFRLLTADGRTVWTRAVDSVVRDDDDPAGKRIGFMLDITKAKAAELELRETMSRLTTLLTHMQAGVLVEDAQRRVVMVNDTLCGLFRAAVRPSTLAGLPASAAVSHLVQNADDPAAFLRRTDDLLIRRWPAVAEPMELADGRVLEFDFQPIVDDGLDLGALWMFRDVTSRVQNEDGARPGTRRGRRGLGRQVAVPRLHVARDPDTDARRAGDHRPAAHHRARPRAARTDRRGERIGYCARRDHQRHPRPAEGGVRAHRAGGGTVQPA